MKWNVGVVEVRDGQLKRLETHGPIKNYNQAYEEMLRVKETVKIEKTCRMCPYKVSIGFIIEKADEVTS